mmetsp:Transcript_43701/g.115561  ORF Transcript_43701/g.115561 Transcript_43701/m.115561 type:complete len:230 (+) Transcript_43701:62-751(+)
MASVRRRPRGPGRERAAGGPAHAGPIMPAACSGVSWTIVLFHSLQHRSQLSSRTHAWLSTCLLLTTPGTSTNTQAIWLHTSRSNGAPALKNRLPMSGSMMAPITMASRLIGRPVRKKSRTRSGRVMFWDFASTITFGGAAVGSVNAKEHATVAGKASASGLYTASMAVASSMGTTVLAVPTAENSWHARDTMLKSVMFIRSGWTLCVISAMLAPRAMSRPDCLKPKEIA